MFSILGLFNPVACPDEACTRSPCLFSHDVRQKPRPAPGPVPPKQERSATHLCKTNAPSESSSQQRQARPHSNSTKSNGNSVTARQVAPSPPPPPPLRARTPTSIGVSLTPDVPPMSVAAMDMARGLTAQSSRVPSNSSNTGGGGYSRGPIQQDTKTLANGMLKRPNKISKPAPVRHARVPLDPTCCDANVSPRVSAVFFRIIELPIIVTQLSKSADIESGQ